jgi:hypothetical protein
MTDAFKELMREADKPVPVHESIAKYAAALAAGTHQITSMTIAPKRQWVGLTEDEVFAISNTMPYADRFDFAAAIEAKLKEKNA